MKRDDVNDLYLLDVHDQWRIYSFVAPSDEIALQIASVCVLNPVSLEDFEDCAYVVWLWKPDGKSIIEIKDKLHGHTEARRAYKLLQDRHPDEFAKLMDVLRIEFGVASHPRKILELLQHGFLWDKIKEDRKSLSLI